MTVELLCGLFSIITALISIVGVALRINRAIILLETAVKNLTERYDELEDLEHAYAITIHKSQGSEYGVVIIPAYMYSPRLLTRNLLYTAVTRAQRMVIIVGRADIVQLMVENKRLTKRYTGLRYMLEALE